MQKIEDEARIREEANELLKLALTKKDTYRKKAEEAMNHQVSRAALEDMKKVMEDIIEETEKEEKMMYEDGLARCEETRKALEREVGLRREAEEKAIQEAVAKQEALAALRKAQQRYTEYSFQELQAATGNFEEGYKLGEGGYGCV